MVKNEEACYYVSWVKWKAQAVYALWINKADNTLFWCDDDGKIPLFTSPNEVATLAARLGVQIHPQQPELQDLHSVWQWLSQPHSLPLKECLEAWNAFSELSSGVGAAFSGNRKGPVRNRLFDKLMLNDGIIQLNQQGRMELHSQAARPWAPRWNLQERRLLKRILQQGFRLWQKHTYLVDPTLMPPLLQNPAF